MPWSPRLHPKASCYRVLVMATMYPRTGRPRYWWPIVAADTEAEAAGLALELFGSEVTHEGPGLPVRGEVVVVAVAHLHRTAVHDEHGSSHEPPDVRRHTQ